MKTSTLKRLKRLVMSLIALVGFTSAQAYGTADGPVSNPEISTAEEPVWYLMKSSHQSETNRQNRYMYWNEEQQKLMNEQYNEGMTEDMITDAYRWRLEDAGNGNVYIINAATGLKISVPEGAGAEDSSPTKNTPLVLNETGATWTMALSNTISQAVKPEDQAYQYCFDYVDYSGDNAAYLNAAGENTEDASKSYTITIYMQGVQNASGWFFYEAGPATSDVETFTVNWAQPANGSITVTANDKEINSGAKVEAGTEITITPTPISTEYKLTSLTVNEETITPDEDGIYKTIINGETTIAAVFEKVVKYRITWPGSETMQGNSLKVVFAGTETEVIDLETLVPEGTELEIIPTTVPGYHLSALSYTISGLQNVPFTIGNEPYTFIVEGGTEDPKMGYFVIISAEFTPDTYTLSTSVNPAEGGSVSVTSTEGTPVEGNLTYGQTIVITASANDNYKLQSLDVTGATKVDGQENQYTVEGDVTVTATFVEDAPVETWSEITLITMSANKPGDADVSAVTYNGEWVIQNSGASNEYGEEFTKVHGPYIAAPQAGDYLAVKYNVPANAKYKFSFLSKRSGGLTEGMKLCYGKSLDALTDASDVMDIPNAGGNAPGIETESQTIDLEAGEYYFVYYFTKATTKVRVADFRLYQLDGSVVEPTPEYTVTLNKPENGNLSVTYNNGEKDITVSTEDATEAQTFDVAEGTKLTVTVTPAKGYQLATLSPEMTEVADSENVYEYIVTAAVTIEATFEKVFEKYAQDFGRGIGDTGWGYRSWSNTVFTTSTDGSKTIDVDYITNVNSYDIYSDEFVNESNKVTVYQGESFEITINGGMNWLYTKAYIDWNGDGIFDEDVDGTENLGYNPAKEREFGDGTPTKENTRTYTITVPENATVGDTRVRIILGWKQENIDLIPDDEEKVAKYITSTTIDDKKNAMVRDFSMNIKEKEAAPEFNITVKRPANGSLYISYTVNDEAQEIDTEIFENDSEVFSIPENTVMNIYPTAEYDYELDQILPAGMEEKTDLRGRKYYVLTVTEDTTIEATFKAIQYGNVAVTEPEEAQGSIEIEFKNPMSGEWQVADDFYLGAVVFGTELRAKVEAKTGYTLKSVMKNGTPIDKNADGYYYFTVDAEEINISAEFEQEQGTYYTITIDVTKPEQGSVKVEMTENGEIKNVANGDKVKENTELTITPEANEGYIFTTLLIDNRPVQLTDGSYKMTVTKDTKIAPKFKEVVSSFELNWVEPENGTLKLYKNSDLENPLTQKSSIEVGTEIKVVVEENEGYDLSKVYYKYFPTEKTVDIAEGENGYVFTVEADNENPNNSIIYVYADFEPETYTLTTEVTPAEGGSVSVTVDYKPVKETVKYGDVITVTVKENPGYIHENTVVEGAEKVEGQAGKYTVKGNVTIKVTFKKDTSSINSVENGTVYYNAEEEVLYTGAAKSVRVYDLSGRLVLNAENQETVSLAELAEGVYTAVVDNATLKLKK